MASSAGKVSVPFLHHASPPPRTHSCEFTISSGSSSAPAQKKGAPKCSLALAQKTRLSAGYALDGFVGGKGVCPFPASHFAAFSRELVFNPRFRAARLLRQRKKRSTKVLPCAGAEDEIRTRATGKGTTPLAGEPLEPLGYFCISCCAAAHSRAHTLYHKRGELSKYIFPNFQKKSKKSCACLAGAAKVC